MMIRMKWIRDDSKPGHIIYEIYQDEKNFCFLRFVYNSHLIWSVSLQTHQSSTVSYMKLLPTFKEVIDDLMSQKLYEIGCINVYPINENERFYHVYKRMARDISAKYAHIVEHDDPMHFSIIIDKEKSSDQAE